MVRTRSVRYGWWMGWLVVLLVGLSRGVAEEPAQRFLEALRERGYDDTALEYLEQVKDHPGVPVVFRVAVPYERGVSLLRMAAKEVNHTQRARLLDQAEEVLKQFVEQQPGHPSALAARRELGNLLLLRGDLKREMADAEGRPELKKEALADLDAAQKVFDRASADLETRLASLKSVPEGETSLLKLRNRLRDEQLETLLLSAQLQELRADIFPDSSPDHAKALRAAAKAYEKIYHNYGRKLAGRYARFYQARCLAKAGDLDQALAMLQTDILDQPAHLVALRDLKTQALELAIRTWARPEQKKFKEAVRRGKEWLAGQTPNERNTPRWLVLELTVAEAMTDYAEMLKSDPKAASQRSGLLRDARSMARHVARIPGPLRNRARSLLERLPGATKLAAKDTLPDTIEDTEALISEAFDAYTTLNGKLEQQKQTLAAERDESKRKALQTEIEQLTAQVGSTLERTKQLVEHALALGGGKLSPEKRTRFLYQLAFVNFNQGRNYDTYVLGFHVATRYRDVSLAKSTAALALRAALRLFAAAEGEDHRFESDLVRRTTRFIIDTWPETPEAEDAINVAVQFEILEGDLDRAETLVRRLRPESPHWIDARLRVGQAFWSKLVKQRKGMAADARAAAEAEFKALRAKVIDLIAEPAGKIESLDAYDLILAQGVLDLVLAYIEEGRAADALQWIDDPKRGLLALSRSDKANAFPPLFRLAVYQTALRALVGVMASSGESNQGAGEVDAGKRLRQLMADLQKELGSDAQGQRKLIGLYVSLANQLNQEISAKQSPGDRLALARPMARLLEAVSAASQDPIHLRWSAKTLRDLAESLKGNRSTASFAAELDQRSVKILNHVLELARQKPGWLDSATEFAVRYQLATAQHAAGQFATAVETYRDVLKIKPTMLAAQAGAAEALHDWGVEEKRSDILDKAIGGAFPDAKGKNIVWGWSRLATITMRYPKFRQIFHKARYYGALDSYLQSQWTQNSGVKKEKLRTAKRAIAQTYQLFPDLGGKEWRSRYDALLHSIQRDLGETPAGIRGLSAGRTRRRSGSR